MEIHKAIAKVCSRLISKVLKDDSLDEKTKKLVIDKLSAFYLQAEEQDLPLLTALNITAYDIYSSGERAETTAIEKVIKSVLPLLPKSKQAHLKTLSQELIVRFIKDTRFSPSSPQTACTDFEELANRKDPSRFKQVCTAELAKLYCTKFKTKSARPAFILFFGDVFDAAIQPMQPDAYSFCGSLFKQARALNSFKKEIDLEEFRELLDDQKHHPQFAYAINRQDPSIKAVAKNINQWDLNTKKLLTLYHLTPDELQALPQLFNALVNQPHFKECFNLFISSN